MVVVELLFDPPVVAYEFAASFMRVSVLNKKECKDKFLKRG